MNFVQGTLYPIALHGSIDGGGRCVWHVNVFVQVISFFAEVCCVKWHVISYRVIDVDSSVVIASFYYVDEAWVIREIFGVLNSCGS